MTPRFRALTPDDVDHLVELMRCLYENDGMPFHEARARAGLAAIAAGDWQPGRVWLIEADGSVAGYVVLTFAFSLEFGGWHGFIDELFVREPFRGLGLGSRAIELAASTCRVLGMHALLLEADLTNDRATRLYRRVGFREHRRRLMCRELDGPA
ncbi:MAG: GNAT family N-acetyltransferase [Vicinamibacterales bacterium]